MLRHTCGYALANKGHDTRALQAYLGHKNIQHTVRYTELSPTRFKDFCVAKQFQSARDEQTPARSALGGEARHFSGAREGLAKRIFVDLLSDHEGRVDPIRETQRQRYQPELKTALQVIT
jgi:Phage integrase family